MCGRRDKESFESKGLKITREGVEGQGGTGGHVVSLDDICLFEVIGHGSGGVVHKAQQLSTGRVLAVKVRPISNFQRGDKIYLLCSRPESESR